MLAEPWLVWLSWSEHHPIHQKIGGLIPDWGAYEGQPINVFHVDVSLSLSQINKHFKNEC